MMQLPRFLVLASSLLLLQAQGLRIACKEEWIEHTPLVYAASFYTSDTISLTSGGIPNLSDTSVDLAGNAETQGLKYYPRNKNSRLIGIVVEVSYRLVANKAARITTLANLRGKRIGIIPGTSSEAFVHQLLASAGLSQNDYTTVGSNACMREPCGANTFPSQLRDRRIDAFGVWETAVELGIRALGEGNAAVFKNASVYREVYSLYSTVEKLQDAKTRQKIVQYVRALNQTYDAYRNASEEVYGMVSRTVGTDVPVLKAVWEDHVWGPGRLDKDLVDYLERQDQYLARVDRRQPLPRAELERFVDTSVYEEAMAG